MLKDDPVESFGCERCWPASAKEAWAARRLLAVDAVLIDESHFIVAIRCCLGCGQYFLGVTTEMIDWVAGEDPIYRTLIPITQSELADLTRSVPPSEGAMNALGVGRRSLKYDWPSDQPPAAYWSTGVLIGPHH